MSKNPDQVPTVPCDCCKVPVRPTDSRYAPGDRYNQDGVLIRARHWSCNETNGPFQQLKRALDRSHD